MDSSIGNPYDFANPVSDPNVFAGRKAELQTVRYYLDQAKNGPRAVSLAIIGPRGSGKTSVLNMIAVEAGERGCAVVRVNLDEGDAVSPMLFVFRILDSVISTLAQKGVWGGVHGTTYQKYLNLVTTYSIPSDTTFYPFFFALQYASAMSAHNEAATMTNSLVEHDLQYLSETVQVPIVLLFDECNVLGSHRILLEKLRNLFMNTPGYLLCLAGTDELFPMISDVFSPIVRQFKKIRVSEFTDVDDTSDCIRLPLESAGLDPQEVIGPPLTAFADELHQLTGGKPYEIQLVCHKCFRRVQQKDREAMVLDSQVLEDVRSELASTQDLSDRSALRFAESLSTRHLMALDVLGQCNPPIVADRLWQTEYLFNAEKNFTKASLDSCLSDLVAWGVLSRDGALVRFAGDDFDRIYLKYFGRERGLKMQVRSTRPDRYFAHRFGGFLRSTQDVFVAGPRSVQSARVISLQETSEAMAQTMLSHRNPLDSMPYASQLYTCMFTDYLGTEVIHALHITLATPWATADTLVWERKPGDGSLLRKVGECLSEMQSRCEAAEAVVTVESGDIQVQPPDKLRDLARGSEKAETRAMVAMFHYAEALECHGDTRDRADRPHLESWYHAGIALELQSDWPVEPALGIGYMMATGPDTGSAEKLLLKVATEHPSSDSSAVAYYDLSIMAATRHQGEQALEFLSLATDRVESLKTDLSQKAWTLQLLACGAQGLSCSEMSIDLPSAITKAREALMASG